MGGARQQSHEKEMSYKSKAIKAGLFAALIILIFVVVKTIRRFLAHPERPPNVVIVVMDTVRQDHLACYGYHRNTTPNLAGLIESSRIYYNAYSTSAWTSPAHASLFTGLFPIAHKTTQENWTMARGLVTLAEVFSIKGYETFGISENPLVSKRNNFDQGFSRYYETWRMSSQQAPLSIAPELFEKILTKRKKRDPFFIFVNLIEAHSPYDSSGPFRDRFLSDRSLRCENNQWHHYFLGRREFTSREIEQLNELYDAEILFVDHLVGEMTASLKKRGLWDDTIFIVTSDHGENIGDHEMMDHVFSLYESLIKIPLIIHYPRRFPPSSEDYSVVQLPDIFPTLLNLVGVEPGAFPSQGRDLLGEDSGEKRYVFCEYYYPKQAFETFREQDREDSKLDRFKRRLRAIISNNMKLIWASDGKHELYDLAGDPQESANLINKAIYSERSHALIKTLESIVHDYEQNIRIHPVRPEEEIDDETLEALKSLGYMQ